MNAHLIIDELTGEFRIKTRAKLHEETDVSDWSDWFTVPVEDCVEASTYGPCSIREVEWIEMDPVVEIHVGRLVKIQVKNYTIDIQNRLEASSIRFEIWAQIFRVFLA